MLTQKLVLSIVSVVISIVSLDLGEGQPAVHGDQFEDIMFDRDICSKYFEILFTVAVSLWFCSFFSHYSRVGYWDHCRWISRASGAGIWWVWSLCGSKAQNCSC